MLKLQPKIQVSSLGGFCIFGCFFFGGIMGKKKTEIEDEMLDIDGASSYMKLSKWTLYQMTRRNEIPVHRPSGGKLVFIRRELEEFIRGNDKRK
jgi:excisionase family DNA binding protein